MRKGLILSMLFGIGLLAASVTRASSSSLAAAVYARQEAAIAKQLAAMNADPDGIFYARSELSPARQESRAQVLLEEIRKLSEVGAFDSPDPDRLMALTQNILQQAPDTRAAQMAHWNLHFLAQAAEDETTAEQALLSYLDKYPDDQVHGSEALDKLSAMAVKAGNWDAALYFADRLLEQDSTRPALLLTRARALIRLGDAAGGKQLLEQIIRQSPDTVQANLAREEMIDHGSAASTPELEPFSPAGDISEPAETAAFSSGDEALAGAYRLTMARIRSVLAGGQMYYTEYMEWPKSIEQMATQRYVEEENIKDAWGRPLLFKIDPERNACWVASAGDDGQFGGFDQQGTYSELVGQDIIAVDTDFTFAPIFPQ